MGLYWVSWTLTLYRNLWASPYSPTSAILTKGSIFEIALRGTTSMSPARSKMSSRTLEADISFRRSKSRTSAVSPEAFLSSRT